MSSSLIRKRVLQLSIDPKSRYATLAALVMEGFFDSPVSSAEVVRRIKERFGKRWKTSHVQTYMRKFMDADIVHAVKPEGHKINYWVLASVTRNEALSALGKARGVREIEEELFSEGLLRKLGKDFRREIDELRSNFGRNGTCTAFLLRKILEKLIIIVFGKNGREALLEDRNRPGGWVGLKEMIDIAAREKLSGVPFIIPKTAREISGIKFLGDTAAHNPLVNVDMSTVLPQIPFIVTAYEELAKRL
ncbi:MAG: hypothetical protein ACLQDV_05490 [Candidatus Binataceae bacterium]